MNESVFCGGSSPPGKKTTGEVMNNENTRQDYDSYLDLLSHPFEFVTL